MVDVTTDSVDPFKGLLGRSDKNAIIVKPTNEDFEGLLEGRFKVPATKVNEGELKNDAKSMEKFIEYETKLNAMKLDRELIGTKGIEW